MPASINRIAALLLLAFLLLAGALGYWAANRPTLTARADNPRLILAEQRIPRGRIVDRHGETIVESVGQRGSFTRRTLYPDAAPFVGYYSINYGTAGVEQEFDGTLRGTLGRDPALAYLDTLLHRSPIGRGVELTIDLEVQRLADALLWNRTGAGVVLSVPDGDVLALTSHPTFDPNTLDEKWDQLRTDPSAPLLNRATQGQYQPGTALQPILLSEALRRGIAKLDDTPEFPAAAFRIDARALTCRDGVHVVTLADALASACPMPFADLGAALGSDPLQEIAAAWGLTETNAIDVQSAQPFTQSFALTDTQALRQFAAGQGSLTVSPMQMALVASTLAARGQLQPARIVSATQSIGGTWQRVERPAAQRILPAGIAEAVIGAMTHTHGAAWHAGMGLSGSSRLLWFIGLMPADQPRYAVAVLIEESAGAPPSAQGAADIGRMLLGSLP